MTSPHQIFSSNSGEPEASEKGLRPRTADSIYCADCLCGRHFETSSREWICPNCHLGIVIDWGHPDIGVRNYPAQNHSTTTEAA